MVKYTISTSLPVKLGSEAASFASSAASVPPEEKYSSNVLLSDASMQIKTLSEAFLKTTISAPL